MQIICRLCKESHKADSFHFPVACYAKVINKEGKEEKQKVGYICRKCCQKGVKEDKRKKQEAKTFKI